MGRGPPDSRNPHRVLANKRHIRALDAARSTPIFSRMAKSSARSTPPPPPPQSSFWLPFLMVGIVGALLGSTITYLALRPQLERAARANAATAMPLAANAGMPADINHAPPANLTAGMPPAQAERTLGNFYYDHQNWPEAIRRYESAIKQGSDDSDIRTDLGNAYRFSGRPQDALAQYELAQRMNPQHEFSLFNQGGLYLEDLNDRAKAIETWNAYLARFPNGRNVTAARQLIAQTTGAPAPLAMPGAAPATSPHPAPSAPDAADQRLFDLVKGAPKKP